MLAYTKACIDLGELIKMLQDEGYFNIVIPSRGAYPFYKNAQMSHIIDIKNKNKKFEWRLNSNPILLPFTSDIGVDQSAPDDSFILRKFWCKVLRDYITNQRTIYSKFYEEIVDLIGNNVLHVPTYNLTPRKSDDTGTKFIFIDTVISGKASYEILKTFDDIGISDYHAILFIDKNGERLKDSYKTFLESKKMQGKATLFFLPNIFSEDSSPLLNDGICSIVFPNIIEESYNNINEFKNDNNAAGGIWLLDLMSSYYGTETNGARACTSMLLHFAVQLHKKKLTDALFDMQFESMTNVLDNANTKNNILLDGYTGLMAKNRFKIKGIDISTTRSHIIRMNFPTPIMKAFSSKIRSL